MQAPCSLKETSGALSVETKRGPYAPSSRPRRLAPCASSSLNSFCSVLSLSRWFLFLVLLDPVALFYPMIGTKTGLEYPGTELMGIL